MSTQDNLDPGRWSQDPILFWVRQGVIGRDATIRTPHGTLPKRYFDYTASGLPFAPIEDLIRERVLPWMANTHTEASATGGYMTELYAKAHASAAREVGADPNDDVVIFTGSGATGAINKLIRCIGLIIPEPIERMLKIKEQLPEQERPLVVITRMEHHSNDLPWRESIADVVMIGTNEHGVASAEELDQVLSDPKYKDRPLKIGSFSAASNVTGIVNDVDALARVMHKHGGYACFDYAAAAPYVKIDMHPEDPAARKDAVFISVHKYLGGPQTPGLLVANKRLFRSRVPVEPGGGTVIYTSPWDHRYIDDLQHREEGGTPNIVGVIRAGLVFDLKREITPERIQSVEEHFVRRAIDRWRSHPNIHILGAPDAQRIGIVSLVIDEGRCHYNLAVRLLSDRYGIQIRGGCMCAGTYGHDLLGISPSRSFEILCAAEQGDMQNRPGWMRISFSPATGEEQFRILLRAVEEVAENWQEWGKDYEPVSKADIWLHKSRDEAVQNRDLKLSPPRLDAIG